MTNRADLDQLAQKPTDLDLDSVVFNKNQPCRLFCLPEIEGTDIDSRGDEREGLGRKWEMNEIEITEEINKRPTGHGSLTWVTTTADMQMLCNIFPILSSQQ